MDEQQVPKKLSTGAMIAVAVVLAIAIGGGAYAYANNKATKEKADLQAKITELQNQIDLAATEAATAVASTITKTPVATTDETADWKTYTNDEYGFSFKYPSEWKLEQGANNNYPNRIVSVTSNEPNKNKVWAGGPNGSYHYDQMAVKLQTQTSISDWIKASLAGGVKDNSKVVTINGEEFTEIVPGSDPDFLAELIMRNGKLFSIIFDFASGRSDLTSTQENILSTFQFTK